MTQFTDFYEAYSYLEGHHAFEHPKYKEPCFTDALTIEVVRVNPETNAIDDDQSKNTKTQVWLEAGDWYQDEDSDWGGYCHDTDLDCGGDTFEEAIIEMANLVREHYGDNPAGYGDLSPEEQALIDQFFKDLEKNIEGA